MRLSALRTPAAGVLSGVLFALAFPPFGATVLLPLAPVPWLVALAVEPRRGRALVSGLLFGLAFWCVSIPWISYVVTNYGGQSPLMGAVCVFLLALILAEWPALVAWGVAAAAPSGSGKRLAVFPLLWTASEHARTVVYGGFPWNLTGWGLAGRPLWIRSAEIWGVYGVGFLAVVVTSLLAAFAIFRKPRFLLFAAVLVLIVGALGSFRDTPRAAGAVRVALLQPNLREEDRHTDEGAAAGYGEVLRQGRAAAAKGVDLLVFPESALPLYWDRSPRLRADLSALAQECRCAILFNDVTEEADGRVSNAARVLTPDGLAEGTYRKVHLVPFGEYVPLPKLFFFVRRISSQIGEFTPAETPVVLRAGDLALGIGVCYEILYPELSRRQTADGANLLATISNDSWYGKAGAQEQHFAGAVFRAVENGRWLVRSAITGISGIVSPYGEVEGRLPGDTAGVVYGRVFPRSEETAWTRWGHWLPVLADGGGLAVLLFGLARWLRSRSSGRAEPGNVPTSKIST